MTPVDSILARLLALHPKRIDLSLDRMRRVLERLGNPEKRVPPVIHVAGTNGKGSTIAFLRAMLEAAGRSVHVYTSPNLVRVNERFRLGGMLVSDAALADALAECEHANGDSPITLFEIETAAAFVLFARHPADYLLLEVGLGGRLDATNVIERTLASVVTPVSMDHVEFLGDTIEKIAAEKAGIFRAGVPAVIAPQTDLVAAVLERHAERARAPLHASGQQWHAGVEQGRLVYQDEKGLLDLPPPKLFGRHQFDNAGTAIAALRAGGVNLPARAIEQGLTRAEWPARLQRLTSGKLVSAAPAGAELWLDGGHNADGGRAIAAALGDLEERVSRPLVLVVGMLSTKDRSAFLRNFTGLVRRVFGVPIHQEKGVPADAIAVSARAAGMPADAAPSIEDALNAIGNLGFEPPPRILITGSLYLAGEVLAANGTELL
ncbi:MAG: folylpolyglutamate synthase/dihydrofolate synthase family protein [Xanthobacteraceae bacterium]